MRQPQGKSKLTGLFTVLLVSLVVVLTFRNHIQEILRNILSVSAIGFLALLILGGLYQLLDAVICLRFVRTRLFRFSFRQALDVVLIGVFGNVATLAAGSIPMQSYYLYRKGMDAGASFGILTLEYAAQKLSLLLYATFMLVLKGRWLAESQDKLLKYILSGYAVCTLITSVLILFCTWDKIRHLLNLLTALLPDNEKWVKRKEIWQGNLASLYSESQFLLQNRAVCISALAVNFLKYFCLFSIPVLAFRCLGIAALSFGQTQLLSSLAVLIANAIPNIAGMGPTEFAFLLIFSSYVPQSQAMSALVLYRTATYFFPFLMSSAAVLYLQRSGKQRKQS